MNSEIPFGAWLKQQRRVLDRSREDLANQVGCSVSLLEKLEAGERRPSREIAARIALCLAIPPEQRDAFVAAARAGRAPQERGQLPTPVAHATVIPPHTRHLPAPMTSFIGREWEVDTLAARLRTPDVRLVTLTGAGGVGKTRLALQIASALLDTFPNGVWFVDLAPISDPALVLATIAQALGVREQPSTPIVATLRTVLRAQQLLMLLDNFENLLVAAPELAALLAEVPGLKVLVTSREALRLYGEHIVVVAPLSVPEPTAIRSAKQLTQYAAVQLFVARAQAASECFRLTDANAPAVAAICARLDGLPLAIELVAAQIPLFPPTALLTRLEQRLPMLTRGPRDVPTRQQTLHDTIDWSYTVLDAGEQTLFTRLGVFVGGWTEAAAGAICNGEGDLPIDTLAGLASLIDKSLLRQAEGRDGEPRFVILETIREYARERLQASGDLLVVAQKHAVYYLALAERAQPQLRGQEQESWLRYLDQEHENLRLALQWSLDHEDIAMAARLCAALWRFWDMRAHLNEGRRWLEQTLARCASVATAQRANVIIGLGVLELRRDNYPQALALLQISLVLFRELADKRGIASALGHLGLLMHLQGDDAAAQSALEESVALFNVLEDHWSVSNSLNTLGAIAQHHGHHDQALTLFEASLALQRAHCGDKQNLSYTLNALGWTAHAMGGEVRADALLTEALNLRRELGDKRGIAVSLNNIGAVAQDRGDNIRAKPYFVESLTLFQDLGNNWYIAHCLQQLAAVMITEEHPQRAAHLCAAAQTLREAINAPLWPSARAHYEQIVSTAREQLAPAAFAAIWAAGSAMPLEQTVAYALRDWE